MNKKGVTLVELIIVIVIIGIISAFAVPAVGRYLTNAQQSAVLRDAQEFRSAANSLCIEQSCTVDTVYDYAALEDLIDNFDDGAYESMTATKTADGWTVELEAAGENSGNWEYVSSTDPIDASLSDDPNPVTVDDND